MGRFGDMISKAGDAVQQAGQEFKRSRQEAQQQNQDRQAQQWQQQGQQQYQQYGQNGQHSQYYQGQPQQSSYQAATPSPTTWSQPATPMAPGTWSYSAQPSQGNHPVAPQYQNPQSPQAYGAGAYQQYYQAHQAAQATHQAATRQAEQVMAQQQTQVQAAQVAASQVRSDYERQLEQAQQKLSTLHLEQERAAKEAAARINQENRALQERITQQFPPSAFSPSPQNVVVPRPVHSPVQPPPATGQPSVPSAQTAYPALTYDSNSLNVAAPAAHSQNYAPPPGPPPTTPGHTPVPPPNQVLVATPSSAQSTQFYSSTAANMHNLPYGSPASTATSNSETTRSDQAYPLPSQPPQATTTMPPIQSPPVSHQINAAVANQPARTGTPRPAELHPSGVTPLFECIEEPISYEMDWLYHPSAPYFLVCGRCYVDDIYDTKFRETFLKTTFTDKTPRRCLFGTDRVKQKLWPHALSSGNLDYLVEYMKRRPSIPHCPQQIIKEAESWYTTDHIPGMTICKACFEDKFVGTEFSRYYKLEQMPSQCYCDCSMFYFKRVFDTHAKTSNWAAFTEQMKIRVQFPACPTQTIVQSNERGWYTCTKGPKGLTYCVACYYDYFHNTEDESFFKLLPQSDTKVRCMMAFTNLLLPARQAISKRDRNIYWNAIHEVDNQPLCDPDGAQGAIWYTLPNNPPEFAVCGACYGGIVASCGGKSFFKPHPTLSKNDKWICSFNVNHVRRSPYLLKYAESLNKGTVAPFAEYAGTYGAVPVCNRRNVIGDRKFWGWGVVAICEECYLSFAKGTKLEPQFVLKGEFSPTERMCDMYSPRMRKIYTQACENNDLEGLIAFGKHRHEVWSRTIAVCDQILAQHKMQAERAMTLAMAGTMFKAAGALVDVSGGHTHTVGNSFVGYGYANSMEMEGAVLDKQSGQIAAGVNNPLQYTRVALLEHEWSQVE